MSRLIESIKLSGGQFHNLLYHQARMNQSWRTLYGIEDNFNLEEFLMTTAFSKEGLYKCRLLYDDKSKEIEFSRYQIKSIQHLRIVEDDRVRYEFKFEDRTSIQRLFNLRNGCDDILIVKNGYVTDSSYANIVFRSGHKWFTPKSALLNGTMRAKLLSERIIEEREIRLSEIHSFESVKLINAMLEFNGPEIPVSGIVI